MGCTATPYCYVCGELLPRLFTLTLVWQTFIHNGMKFPSGAVILCYIVLNVAAYRPLTGMVPYAARTFLPRLRASDRRAYCGTKIRKII